MKLTKLSGIVQALHSKKPIKNKPKPVLLYIYMVLLLLVPANGSGLLTVYHMHTPVSTYKKPKNVLTKHYVGVRLLLKIYAIFRAYAYRSLFYTIPLHLQHCLRYYSTRIPLSTYKLRGVYL